MASENVLNLNADTFASTIKESAKPVVVDFWAEWCGPCKMLSPVLDEIADANSEFTVAKVNVDENQALAAEYGVRSIPLLLFFKDGEKRDEIVGVTSKDNIVAKLEAL